MKKVIMSKKEIADNLLYLTDIFIQSGAHPDTDKVGRKMAHAQATFLLELAKSYVR